MSIRAKTKQLLKKDLEAQEIIPEWDGSMPEKIPQTEPEDLEQEESEAEPESMPLQLDSSKEYAVIVENVVKQFGEEQVLKNVSHAFEKGKVHGIVGNNGSGKTVMFKCICGFMQPTSGRVLVRGKEIGKDVDFPENIGIIIESPGFLAFKTYRFLRP